MDDYLVSHLITLGFLILVSIFFSAVETALLSFPKALLESRAQEAGLLARAFREWRDHPNRILTTILIGNNGVNIAASTLVAYMAVHYSEAYGWSRTVTGTVASVTLTFFIIVFAEALPKVTARANTEPAAHWLIIPIYLFDKILSPFTWALVHFMGFFLSKVGHPNVSLVTEEDIKTMIEMGTESGTIHEDEKKMMHSILKFTDTKVNEVMIPRTEMFCVEVGTGMDKLLELVVQNGYSRMPVYRGNLDNIMGIVNTRDLLAIWKNKELIVLQDLLRKPYFVPETMRVDRLLHEFKRGNIHMAVVVDEYGGTAGLVTLEDLVEEIVGEIRDEYDVEEEKPITRQEDGTWLIDAGVALDEVNEALGIHLKPKGDVATLGGYLTELAGRLPRKGRSLDDREAVFTVLEASDRKVNKVKALKREQPLPETEAEAAPAAKPKKRKPKASKPKEPSEGVEASEPGEAPRDRETPPDQKETA